MLSKKTIPLFKFSDAKKSFLKPHRILEGAKRARHHCTLLKAINGKNMDTDIEIWRPVKNWEGIYEVSNFGKVKSLDGFFKRKSGHLCRRSGKILSQQIRRDGYLSVHLCNGDKDLYPTVHRLVAIAFINNPENKRTVNHEDGIKINNHWKNLSWATASEQQQHALRIGLKIPLKGMENSLSKLTDEEVLEIYHSKEKQKIIAERYEILQTHVSQIKMGRNWTHVTGAVYKRKRKIA